MTKSPDVLGAPDVKKLVKKLTEEVEQHVLSERRWDPLTKLPNDLALQDALKRANNTNPKFWIAFVEVNKFKSVNDEFGYLSANVLLERLGQQLQKEEKWSPGLRAFRAHGDEFYLLGTLADGDRDTADRLAGQLRLVRDDIGKLEVPAYRGSTPAIMKCTVSIAWLTVGYLLKPPQDQQAFVVTEPAIRRCIESAMAFAKRSREVVAFEWDMLGREPIDLRGTCTPCGAKYTVNVERKANRETEPIRCPNCGIDMPRPAAAGASSAPPATAPPQIAPIT